MVVLKQLIRSLQMPSFLNESVVIAFESIFDNTSGINGAGAFIICPHTKTVLMGKRGNPDKFADHWCTFGGTVDQGEDPLDTIPRELNEEAGITSDMIHMILPPMYVDETRDGFKFMTVLATSNIEFPVKLNNEHSDYGWFNIMDLPTPIHPGVSRMLANPVCMKNILAQINR